MVGSCGQEQAKITREVWPQPNGSPHFISSRYQGVLGLCRTPALAIRCMDSFSVDAVDQEIGRDRSITIMA